MSVGVCVSDGSAFDGFAHVYLSFVYIHVILPIYATPSFPKYKSFKNFYMDYIQMYIHVFRV